MSTSGFAGGHDPVTGDTAGCVGTDELTLHRILDKETKFKSIAGKHGSIPFLSASRGLDIVLHYWLRGHSTVNE
jgi:hypothetical protein